MLVSGQFFSAHWCLSDPNTIISALTFIGNTYTFSWYNRTCSSHYADPQLWSFLPFSSIPLFGFIILTPTWEILNNPTCSLTVGRWYCLDYNCIAAQEQYSHGSSDKMGLIITLYQLHNSTSPFGSIVRMHMRASKTRSNPRRISLDNT